MSRRTTPDRDHVASLLTTLGILNLCVALPRRAGLFPGWAWRKHGGAGMPPRAEQEETFMSETAVSRRTPGHVSPTPATRKGRAPPADRHPVPHRRRHPRPA